MKFSLSEIFFVLCLLSFARLNVASSEKKKKMPKPTFKMEYSWLSEFDGGYIAKFRVPVHIEIPSWTMALLFPERIYNITLWQGTFIELSPDGRVVYLKQKQWNGHLWPGMTNEQRLLLRFNITPGIDYNGYSGPKPDIVFLDKVFMPNRTIDYEHEMKVVNYTWYTKPRSKHFREMGYSTIPVSTREPTTTTVPTTTTFNPFQNSGDEEKYNQFSGRGKWWFISTDKTITTSKPPTTPLLSTTTKTWWKFAHKTSTTPPKPTLAAINCVESIAERKRICKKKRRPMKRCFVPQCDGDRFKAVQCRKAKLTTRTGHYCWCVDTRSGVKLGTTLVKFENAHKLNCFEGDQSRTEPVVLTTTKSLITSPTPAYIPEGFSKDGDAERPIFAPRNSYDYAKIIHNSHLFFEAQRSGNLPRNGRISWRASAHTKDGSECNKDLSGGYYHSGDYVKFGFPTAFSMTQLAWSYLEAKDAYEASWQTKFLKDTLKWAADYFIKAHTGQFEFYGQVGDPIYENEEWTRPQNMGGVQRPCYSITGRSPGTDLAAETAAALAATAAVWIESGSNETDPYVQSLIKHAKELFQFADKYRGVYHMSIRAAANFYPSSGYNDELVWAAMWLYIATNDEVYLANVKTKYFIYNLFNQQTEFSWDQKAVGVQLLLAKYTKKRTYVKPLLAFCDSVMPDGTAEYTPQGLLFKSKWGPIRYACNAGFICMVTSKLKLVPDEKKTKYRKFGEDQIDYVLGKTGKSFVVGYGINYPKQPHHRSSSCSTAGKCTYEDFRKPTDNPQVLTGAVVGGPDDRDMWMNDRTNTMSNAVSLDFNSALQSAVAVLKQFQIEYKAWFDTQWKQKSG
ncbi:uncharacterized protein LOC120327569 isoform X1 [Styela clava]